MHPGPYSDKRITKANKTRQLESRPKTCISTVSSKYMGLNIKSVGEIIAKCQP